MCGIKNDKTRKKALITSASMVILIISVLIYTVISSPYLKLSGMNVSLYMFLKFEYFLIIINLIMCIIGLIGFYLISKGMIIYYLIFQILVFPASAYLTYIFFCLGNGILLLESPIEFHDMLNYSNTSLNILASNHNRYFFLVDYYITKVDQLFCSEYCPCNYYATSNLTNRTIFSSSSGATSFKDCPQNVIDLAENYSRKYGFNGPFKEVLITLEKLETKFNCVGFCITNYTDNSGLIQSLDRYLFSDVNSGKPIINGCINAYVVWITRFGINISIFNFLILIHMLAMIIEGFMLLCNYENPEPESNYYGIVIATQASGQICISERENQHVCVSENDKNVEMEKNPISNNIE
jgi:hypothetical protein